MTTTAINVPPGGGQQQQQQPIVIQQPGGQQPIVLQQNSLAPSRYNAQAGLVTGVLQCLAAIATIMCTILALAYGTHYRLGWGIWAGVLLYGPAGILGIVSTGRHRGVIIGYMVLSILSSISAAMQMLYESFAAGQDGQPIELCFFGCYGREKNPTLKALHAVSALAMACEMIIAIFAASFCCCCGACGTSGAAASSTQTVVVQHQQNPGAHVVTYNRPTVQPRQQIPYQPPPYQQQPYQKPRSQRPPQQQPPQQQPTQQPPPQQQPPYYDTTLNFEHPSRAAPTAPAGSRRQRTKAV